MGLFQPGRRRPVAPAPSETTSLGGTPVRIPRQCRWAKVCRAPMRRSDGGDAPIPVSSPRIRVQCAGLGAELFEAAMKSILIECRRRRSKRADSHSHACRSSGERGLRFGCLARWTPDAAYNAVLIGGHGSGERYLATPSKQLVRMSEIRLDNNAANSGNCVTAPRIGPESRKTCIGIFLEAPKAASRGR